MLTSLEKLVQKKKKSTSRAIFPFKTTTRKKKSIVCNEKKKSSSVLYLTSICYYPIFKWFSKRWFWTWALFSIKTPKYCRILFLYLVSFNAFPVKEFQTFELITSNWCCLYITCFFSILFDIFCWFCGTQKTIWFLLQIRIYTEFYVRFFVWILMLDCIFSRFCFFHFVSTHFFSVGFYKSLPFCLHDGFGWVFVYMRKWRRAQYI